MLPANAFNRIADNWRPLLAIAEVAGGDWPQRIADAFAKLMSGHDADEQGLGIMLLSDIQQAFGEKDADKLFSKELVEVLCAMTDRPWPEGRRDKPITEAWLARRLKPFGVHPKSIRIEPHNLKGYELSAFQDAFSRYLPDKGLSNRHSLTTRVNIDENENSNRHSRNGCDALKTHETRINIGLCQRDALKPPTEAIETDRYIPTFTDPDRQAAWDLWEK